MSASANTGQASIMLDSDARTGASWKPGRPVSMSLAFGTEGSSTPLMARAFRFEIRMASRLSSSHRLVKADWTSASALGPSRAETPVEAAKSLASERTILPAISARRPRREKVSPPCRFRGLSFDVLVERGLTSGRDRPGPGSKQKEARRCESWFW